MLRRPQLPKIARIDMTPMAGVLICLLIIFFVLTPIGCGGADVELPQMSSAVLREVPDRAENLNIGITDRGRLFFGGKRLVGGLDELAELLHARVADNPEMEYALLKADVATPFQDVRAVADLCRKAGIRSIRLIANRKDDDDDLREGMKILAALPRS